MCENNLDLARAGHMIDKDNLSLQQFGESIRKLLHFKSRLEYSLVEEMIKEYKILYEKKLFVLIAKKIPNKFFLSFDAEYNLHKKLLEDAAEDAKLYQVKQFCEKKSIEIWKTELGSFIDEIVTLFTIFNEKKLKQMKKN